MAEPNLNEKAVNRETEDSTVPDSDEKRQGGQIHANKPRAQKPGGQRDQTGREAPNTLELAGRGVRANPEPRQGQRSSKGATHEATEPGRRASSDKPTEDRRKDARPVDQARAERKAQGQKQAPNT